LDANKRVYDIFTYNIYSIIMEYTILWNTIELIFNESMVWERYINLDFDSSTTISVTTHGINDILIYKDEEEFRVFQQIIFNDIISKMKTEAQEKRLDFIQIIIINWVKCAFIEHHSHICIMATEEY